MIKVHFVTGSIDPSAYCKPDNTCNSTGSLNGKGCVYGAIPDWVYMTISRCLIVEFMTKKLKINL